MLRPLKKQAFWFTVQDLGEFDWPVFRLCRGDNAWLPVATSQTGDGRFPVRVCPIEPYPPTAGGFYEGIGRPAGYLSAMYLDLFPRGILKVATRPKCPCPAACRKRQLEPGVRSEGVRVRCLQAAGQKEVLVSL